MVAVYLDSLPEPVALKHVLDTRYRLFGAVQRYIYRGHGSLYCMTNGHRHRQTRSLHYWLAPYNPKSTSCALQLLVRAWDRQPGGRAGSVSGGSLSCIQLSTPLSKDLACAIFAFITRHLSVIDDWLVSKQLL